MHVDPRLYCKVALVQKLVSLAAELFSKLIKLVTILNDKRVNFNELTLCLMSIEMSSKLIFFLK